MNKDLPDDSIPLVVDLDGTLVHTDLLYEGILILIKRNFLYLFKCIQWAFKGKAYLKKKIFELVKIRSELLPYNIQLLNFLQKEFNNGRKLVLASASWRSHAIEVSRLYPIFTQVYGTENDINLKGMEKRNMLVNQFGESRFDYIGNSHADVKVFASSRYSYLVNPSRALERKTRAVSDLKFIWDNRKESLGSYLKTIRVYQWIKNILIFVPLITSHDFSKSLVFQSLLAFFSFSLIASSGYVINDLSDLNADRSHPRKRYRPLASGSLSISSGFLLALLLMGSGIYLASMLTSRFLVILIAYFFISVLYSVYLKRVALYDVFLLALLYSIRVVAGSVVTKVPLSFWLIEFSTAIFLSLAFAKRCSELVQIGNETSLRNRGRQYSIQDTHLLQVMGIVSGFLSVLIFSLYINSPEVTQLYSKPKFLWAIGFLFLFWISRIWMITIHGKMTDDPIIFASKDPTSYFIFFITGLILFFSV